MKVKELVALLKKQNQELEVGVEGCDCTASVEGISIDDEAILWIRQHSGVLGGKPITKE